MKAAAEDGGPRRILRLYPCEHHELRYQRTWIDSSLLSCKVIDQKKTSSEVRNRGQIQMDQ